MTRGVPVLDPKRDLVGATPEKLAKALFRPTGPLPARKRKTKEAPDLKQQKGDTDAG